MNYLDALNYGNKLLKLNKIKNHNLDTELLLSKVLKYSRENLLINLNHRLEKKNLINIKNWFLEEKISSQ